MQQEADLTDRSCRFRAATSPFTGRMMSFRLPHLMRRIKSSGSSTKLQVIFIINDLSPI